MVYIRAKCHVPTIQRFTGFHHETERHIKLSNKDQDIITLTFLKTNSCTFCKIHSHSHLKLQTVKNVGGTPN
jgi:hypothetical protein